MQILSYVSFAIGFVFLIGSVVGVVRFADGYQKMQAVTISTSMSMFWFALGVSLYCQSATFAVKAFLIYLFLLITSAVSSHMVVRASLEAGIPVMGKVNRFSEGGDEK